MSDADRIFSEEEIGQVLKRAAEIQGKQPRVPSIGLSMAELRQLAEDSGIDPAFVAAAAVELDADREADQTNWWGGPPSSTVLRSVEGRISDETWEELLAEVRREFDNTGATETRGSTRQWMFSAPDQRQGHLIATFRDGRTKLELFRSIPTLPAPYVLAPILLGLLSLPIIFAALKMSGAPGLATFLVLITSALVASRFGFARANRKSKRQLRDTANRLSELVGLPENELADLPDDGLTDLTDLTDDEFSEAEETSRARTRGRSRN